MVMQTTHAERTYHVAAAERADTERRAALACNDLLTLTQAHVLMLAVDAMPDAATLLVETIFETYGWPAESLDTAHLNEAGRIVWAAYTIYRGEVAA